MLSSVDVPLLRLCALFAPPLALSALAVLHALHRCDFHLWQAKAHCYHSAGRLHLTARHSDTLSQQQHERDGARVETGDMQPASHDAPTVKGVSALLPPHRRKEERVRSDSERRTQPSTGDSGSEEAGPDTRQREEAAALHTAAARWSASRWLSTSLLLAVGLPSLQLAAWTACLLVQRYAQCAAALVLLSVCVAAVVVAFGSWQRRGWYWSGHVAHLLALALSSFIALSLLLTFLSASSDQSSLSFFSRSIHFVCLHLVVLVECRAVSEQEAAAALLPYIRAQERDTKRDDDRRRADQQRKRKQRLEAVRRLLNYHVQHGSDEAAVEEQRGQKQAGSESDEDGSGGPRSVRLSELPSHTHSFASHIQAKAAKARVKHRSSSQRRLLSLRVASVLILVAYSAVIGAAADAPSSDSGSSFDGRYLGVLVSLCILLFDMFIALLSDRLSTAVQLSLALFTRLILVSFDDSGWFIAFCFLFLLYGCSLSYLWTDSFLPHHRLSSRRLTPTLSTRPVRMTLSSFLTETPPSASAGLTGAIRPLASVLQSADSLLSIPAFLSLSLVTLFLMSLCVAYSTHPPLVSVPGISSVQYEQWMVGVLAVLLWLLASAAVFLVKALLFYSFHANWLTGCACVVVQLVFVAGGVYVWRLSASVLFLLLFCLLPPFCVSLLATYCLSIANLPSRRSVRSLLACSLCVVLLSALGVSLSELFSPSHVGWSVVFCVLIALSSGLPLVKYRSTLALDAVDEWSVLLCLFLLSGFLALLSWRLSLSSLGNYLLALSGSGYVGLVLLAGAWSDWRLHSRLTPFSLFVLSAHYVWLLSFSAVLLVLFSAYVGVIALVGVGLYIGLSLCFLYWLWNGYALPVSLRCVLAAVLCVLLLAGVAAAVYLSVESSSRSSVSFVAFSAVYLFVVLCVAVSAALQHYGALSRAPCMVHFSSAVFPVLLFNKRSSTVALLHLPLSLLLSAAALFVLWSLAAIVCGYRDVGLSSSAVCVAVLWLTLRELSFSAPRSLLPLRSVLDETSVLRVRSGAWRLACSGYEGDEAMLAAVRSLEAGHDARRGLRDRQRAMREQMRLSSSSNPIVAVWQLAAARPSTDCLDVDWLLASLHESELAIRLVSCLQNSLDAQSSFMLRLEGDTRRREDESLFALFCVWAGKHKQLPELHPSMQPSDTLSWTPAERRNVRLAADEWTAQRANRRDECEQDRLVEQHAERRREEAAQQQAAVTEQPAVEELHAATVPTDGGSVDPYAALQTAGQARGSSNPAFKAAKPGMSAMQRNRLRATRPHQQQSHAQLHSASSSSSSKKPAQHAESRKPKQKQSEATEGGHTRTAHSGQARAQAPEPAQQHDEQTPTADSDSEKTDSEQADGSQQAQKRVDSQQQRDDVTEQSSGAEQRDEPTKAASHSSPSSAAEGGGADSAPLAVPAVLYSHEEAHALFSRIAAQYDSSGVLWVDGSFLASDSSIYIGRCARCGSSECRPSGSRGWLAAA